MSSSVVPGHPRQKFVFYLAQDVNNDVRSSIHKLVERLRLSRFWTLGPPRLIDSIQLIDDSSPGTPVETVGGELDIYSALPPHALPAAVDRQHLEEIEAIVEAVRDLSGRDSLAFEFELGGTYVGAVEDGEVDRTLKVGLLDEWRARARGLAL
jgi:hypothetical protein